MTQARRHWHFLSAAWLILAVVCGIEQSQAEDWAARYRNDLAFLRQVLADNHPGAVAPGDPRVVAPLTQGYASAAERTPVTAHDYRLGLSAFIAEFRDPHVTLVWSGEQAPFDKQPGFIVAPRHNGLTVVWRDETDPLAPARGERIVACDGAPIGREDASRFRDRGRAPAPVRCKFESALGASERTLAWRFVGSDYRTAFATAISTTPATPGLRVEEAIAWIGLPSFAPDPAATKEMLIMLKELRTRAAALRAGRLIVIDVRGNRGGAGIWGEAVVGALYGHGELAALKKRSAPTAVEWRASPDNLDFVIAAADEAAARYGAEAGVALMYRSASSGIADAMAAGEPLWRRPGAGAVSASAYLRARRPAIFPARVAVLTDGHCISACLDFLDLILQAPGVIQIGAPAGSDTVYGEVRDATLPSGLGAVRVPMKAMRGRPRPDGYIYEPDIAYEGAWREDALRAWVGELLERGAFFR